MKTLNAFALTLLALVPVAGFSTGTESSGGGETIAAQYAAVVQRAVKALKMTCAVVETKGDREICDLVPSLSAISGNIKVFPRERDSILGQDGKPRDAGNNGIDKIYLDVDRWKDKEKSKAARDMVLLAVHEPLVLIGAESNDSYGKSNALVELMKKNAVSLYTLAAQTKVPTAELEEKEFLVSQSFKSSFWGSNTCGDQEAKAAISGGLPRIMEEAYGNCREKQEARSITSGRDSYTCSTVVICSRPKMEEKIFDNGYFLANPEYCSFSGGYTKAMFMISRKAKEEGFDHCQEKQEARNMWQNPTGKYCNTSAVCIRPLSSSSKSLEEIGDSILKQTPTN
jgi:hypothetical protein